MIKGVKFVNIPVRDQARAVAFYTEKLGFVVTTDQAMRPGAQRWIELQIPGADTLISLFTPPGHEERIGTFAPLALWADDVDATYKELRAKGVEFVGPPKREAHGSTVIMIDPEGNRLQIASR
jgi:predicted enzyme related to lactoylglutathione lyase